MALLQVNFFSDILGMCSEMNVILPQKAYKQIGIESNRKGQRYPVLYLLHGMSDDHTIWLRRTSIERYASEKGIAVIMPNASLSWYTDMYSGQKYWSFVSEELPAVCSDFFPNISTSREDTFAAGLSMGGYGALKLGFRKPEKFCAVASLSGGVNIADICEAEKSKAPTIWDNIFGPSDCIRGSENDLFYLAENLIKSDKPRPDIYIWCGTEDPLYNQNVEMAAHLKDLNYKLTYQETLGNHHWKYWDNQIKKVLDWLPIS